MEKFGGLLVIVVIGVGLAFVLKIISRSKNPFSDYLASAFLGGIGLFLCVYGLLALSNNFSWDDKQGWSLLPGIVLIGIAVRQFPK